MYRPPFSLVQVGKGEDGSDFGIVAGVRLSSSETAWGKKSLGRGGRRRSRSPLVSGHELSCGPPRGRTKHWPAAGQGQMSPWTAVDRLRRVNQLLCAEVGRAISRFEWRSFEYKSTSPGWDMNGWSRRCDVHVHVSGGLLGPAWLRNIALSHSFSYWTRINYHKVERNGLTKYDSITESEFIKSYYGFEIWSEL